MMLVAIFEIVTFTPHSLGRTARHDPPDRAAIDSRRGIATDTGIPWKLPGDSEYFREKTANGLIVMGRATYDEFVAPLHGRRTMS